MPPEAETTVLTQDQPNPTTETQTPATLAATEQGSDEEQESSLLNEGDAEPAESAGKDGAGKDKDKGPGAPEAYEAFKVPATWEEKGLALDPKTIEAFTPLAKELGLSQEGAQKLIDFYTGVAEAHSDANEAASVQAVKDMRKGWRDEIKADKQVGHRLPEVKQNMAKMFNAFIPQQGDPKVIAAATQMVGDFKKALDLTGAGDHPAFIRLFDAISQRFTEGSYVAGKGPSPGGQLGPGSKPESAAKALYPSLG